MFLIQKRAELLERVLGFVADPVGIAHGVNLAASSSRTGVLRTPPNDMQTPTGCFGAANCDSETRKPVSRSNQVHRTSETRSAVCSAVRYASRLGTRVTTKSSTHEKLRDRIRPSSASCGC